MKAKIMNLITLTLLLGLLLTAVACHTASHSNPENTKAPVTNAPEKNNESTPVTEGSLETEAGETETHPEIENGTEGSLETEAGETETHPEIETGTDLPTYPGDIEIELPELQEFSKIILSVKDGKVLGATSLDKPADSDIIASYSDFQKLYGYGTIDGINETFFETHVLRLVHTAQSSGSTRYAVESVILEDGKLKVEIIEQLAAISTRDIRYWYVFAAVDKANAETPVEVNITGIQLAG